MHKITFFPLGNADSILITLENEKNILVDFANYPSDGEEDKRIDLANELDSLVDNDFETVAITHADDDHLHGFSEYFYLEHAEKYQGDDRKKIKMLWVPAALILETGLENDAKIVRAEARYRLKNGNGIKVISNPDMLNDWLKSEGLTLEERSNCIASAGDILDDYKLESDGVEFFIHSPFKKTIDDTTYDRNNAGLVMQCRFKIQEALTNLILGSDISCDVWSDIVALTSYYENDDRLEWDIFKISHHCSYHALSEEKDKDKTEPWSELISLYENGSKGGYLISTSNEIPDDDTEQPPHYQAANYYRSIAKDNESAFFVTMEYPKVSKPEPIIITIEEDKATLQKLNIGAAPILTSQVSPKAGKK